MYVKGTLNVKVLKSEENFRRPPQAWKTLWGEGKDKQLESMDSLKIQRK